MIRYLVSYIDSDAGRISYGTVEIHRTEPICTMQDIAQVNQIVRNHVGLSSTVVLGFSVFAEPGEAVAR